MTLEDFTAPHVPVVEYNTSQDDTYMKKPHVWRGDYA